MNSHSSKIVEEWAITLNILIKLEYIIYNVHVISVLQDIKQVLYS